MIHKIIIAAAACDWLMAHDSYGHLAARFIVQAIQKALS
jgi:hypothetical protein